MISTLKNEYLQIGVSSLGGELISLKAAEDSLEYLWQGNPQYWSKQSPILFPIVGRLENGSYHMDGQVFKMEETHGFTKESEFQLVEKAADCLTYKLTDNTETLKKYPFKFELTACYKLEGNQLIIKNSVKNTDDKTIWFSIGAHPGFNCPLYESESMEDYYLEFEQDEFIHRLMLKDNLLNGEKELFLDHEKVVKLSHKLFEKKAIILKGLKSKSVTIKNTRNDKRITVSFDGFPYLGIWSAENDAPFVCIEPWYGITSSQNANVDFREKQGILSLECGKTFECEYSIVVE